MASLGARKAALSLGLGTTTAAAGALYLTYRSSPFSNGPIRLDDSSSLPPGSSPAPPAPTSLPTVERKERLSIYSPASPPLLLEPVHTDLEKKIGTVRKALQDRYGELNEKTRELVEDWLGVERKVERQVLEILPKDESLTPGILYVGVATLTGSIIARNRGILLRLVTPPLFLILSSSYFLPKTSQNLYNYYTNLERSHFPTLHSNRLSLQNQISSTISRSSAYTSKFTDKVSSGVNDAVRTVEDRTGLKVAEALGKAGGKVADGMERVEGVVGGAKREVDGRIVELEKKVEGKKDHEQSAEVTKRLV